MKHIRQIVVYGGYLTSVITVLAVSCPDALAAETTQNWRPVFDLVMRWLNLKNSSSKNKPPKKRSKKQPKC